MYGLLYFPISLTALEQGHVSPNVLLLDPPRLQNVPCTVLLQALYTSLPENFIHSAAPSGVSFHPNQATRFRVNQAI